MAFTIAPFPYHQFFDNNGDPLVNGTVETFLAGTSTPVVTYQDAAGAVSNGTSVDLDSAGRGIIFLDALAYKFVLKNALGATVWTIDDVQSMGLAALSSALNDVVDATLTLVSGEPIMTAPVTAATTVYVTPYQGNRISLNDGSTWQVLSFEELAIPLGSDAADTNYDVFAYISSSAVAVERVAWTNDTTRAVPISLEEGVLVKTGDATRRYLGTYRTTAVVGQSEYTDANPFVWSAYHQNDVPTLEAATDFNRVFPPERLGTGTPTADTVLKGDSQWVELDPALAAFDDTQSASNGAEKVAYTYTIPANTFNVNGNTVELLGVGTLAANANAKTVRVRLGGLAGTVIATAADNAAANTSWRTQVNVARLGSNSQRAVGMMWFYTSSGVGRAVQTITTTTATDTGTIDLVITVEAAANDAIYECAWVEIKKT